MTRIDDQIAHQDHTLNQDEAWTFKRLAPAARSTRLALLRTCAWIALLFLLAMAIVAVICLKAHV